MTRGNEPASLRAKLRALYFGDDPRAQRFRYGMIVFDVLTIAVFILATALQEPWWIVPVDFVLATLLTLDLAARVYAENDRRRLLVSFTTLADVIVIASLLLPWFINNVSFLRVLRTVRLLRSYHLLRDLRASSQWFRRYEDVIKAAVDLGVFVFIVTSVVFVTQRSVNPGIPTYVDALYFTITTLTTTGFGDITLVGPGGRLLAVVVMVVGVSLFLQLLKAVFRPNKVRHECEDCGLQLHDIDSVHCKHCGRTLHIPYEGAV